MNDETTMILEACCLTEFHDWKNKWINTFELSYLSYIMMSEGIKFTIESVHGNNRLDYIKDALRNGYVQSLREIEQDDCPSKNSNPGCRD